MNQGVIYRFKWAAMDASLALLIQASGLRSFEIPHLAFCGTPYGKSPKCWRGDSATLVQHCKPLLESLKISLEAQNLDINILDVIKIELDPCYLETEYGFMHKEHHKVKPGGSQVAKLRETLTHTHNNSRAIPMTIRPVWCNCVCTSAEEYNLALVEDLKEEIAKQLGLSIEGEQNDGGVAE